MTTKIKASNIETGAVTADKLHTTAITDKLGFTPVTPTQLNNAVAAVDLTGLATETYVNNQINAVIDSAPGALNTLNELAAALGDDSNFATTVTNALASKADTSAVNSALALKAGIDSSTGALLIPSGSSAQRPSNPLSGMIRHNTSTGYPEWYDTSTSNWVQFNRGIQYPVEVLIVAGGGGGGLHSGGGGGAGGLLYYGSETPKTPNGSAITVSGGDLYSVIIGAGGASSGGTYTSVPGNGYDGQSSSFSTYTAIGGGGGGSGGNNVPGRNGGSGGGGGRSVAQGAGTVGQGNAGGYPGTGQAAQYPGGGGGGAGQVGGAGNTGQGGNGGNGLQYSINGTATYYAGGGGGNLQDTANSRPPQGTGGLGGGGYATSTDYGQAGTANTGGGGGGANYNQPGGGTGGSGIVIIRYLGSQRASGGTVTSSGGYTIHTFTSSGSFIA